MLPETCEAKDIVKRKDKISVCVGTGLGLYRIWLWIMCFQILSGSQKAATFESSAFAHSSATYDPVVTLSQSCGHSPSWLHSEITLSTEKQCPAPCPEFDVIRLTEWAILIDIRVGNPTLETTLPLGRGSKEFTVNTLPLSITVIFAAVWPWYGYRSWFHEPQRPQSSLTPVLMTGVLLFFPVAEFMTQLTACFLTVFGSPELFIFNFIFFWLWEIALESVSAD